MSCTLVHRDWGTKLPHRRSECEEAGEEGYGGGGSGVVGRAKGEKGGEAHRRLRGGGRLPPPSPSSLGRRLSEREPIYSGGSFAKCIEPSSPGPVEGSAQSAFSVSLMPPNRKRRAAAMDPAAGGAGQQRQNKASAGKKAKKGGGSGSGSGGRWPAVKPKKDFQINRLKGTHLLTIPDFFTSAEAKTFIDVAESMGFTHQGSLGPLKGEAYRDNDRISVTDPLLAQAIWESGINRIFTDISVSGKVATGLNPNIRFYRYTEGQRFGRHIDESVDLGDGSKTYYTLLIYLSGKGSAKDSSAQALVGGETVFYDQRGGVVAEVAPVQGMALLHLHGAKCMLHEARVVKKNAKYVLRSDVVFS